jgi:hypothetical protein
VELLSRRYADTPEEVLQEWAQYGYPAFNADPLLAKEWDFIDGNPNHIRVWFESDGNDIWNGSDDSPSTDLEFAPLTRESCCEANVEGPHTELIDQIGDTWFEQPGGMFTEVFERAPVRGGKFTSRELVDATQSYLPQIQLIRRRNAVPPGNGKQYASDLLRPGAEELLKFEYFDGFLSNLPWDRRNSEGPEVDHIIPRVDKHGCVCGTNSFKNAQVISKKLNGQLSNNCSDPRRRAIIDFYTKPLPPPIVLGLPSTPSFSLLDWMVGQLQDVGLRLFGVTR